MGISFDNENLDLKNKLKEANKTIEEQKSDLKNKLKEANKKIEEQKLLINELQEKIKNNNRTIQNLNNSINKYKIYITNYQKIISQKETEIYNLRTQINNRPVSNNQTNLINIDDIMTVNFISMDSNVHFAVSCIKNNTFAEVEEKLYKQYPEYRETNNNFLANGKEVLRFKTIAENQIGFGLPVALVVPTS